MSDIEIHPVADASPSACIALLRNSERLLEHAEALARENAELRLMLEQSEARRGSLEKRLAAARARVEALIDRLPANRHDLADTEQAT